MSRISVLLDSDANNELDDQHAIAYLLFNGEVFDPIGITINRTRLGGDVAAHAAEAERVVALCGSAGRVPVIHGASGDFSEIRMAVGAPPYDGHEAVSFIIDAAHRHGTPERKLILVAVGKLTNVALALEKAPTIAPKVRVVWLGSNYPDPGEYNLDNDPSAVNYLLNADVEFEIVTVRYGNSTGTAAVRATLAEIRERMPGQGPHVEVPIEGRNGGTFHTFGDYSADLFAHIEPEGDPPARPLYDMAALAIIKNPSWARARVIPAPLLSGVAWVERPQNPRTIRLWEHFDAEAIMADFYHSMEHYLLPR